MSMLAVVRIRGDVHVEHDKKDTFGYLRLHRVNHCVLIPDTINYKGMVNKVKDYVAWGPVSVETVEAMLSKRGHVNRNTKLSEKSIEDATKGKFKNAKDLAKAVFDGKANLNDLGINPVFRLKPPSKGYGRKGIKAPYSLGGFLGNNGEEVNSLIKRMV